MAGSSLHFDSTLITASYGWAWVGVAIPAAAARITLHTDGTPDASANPSAKHLGHTSDGWELTSSASSDDLNVDEQPAAIDTSVSALAIAVAANLVQTQDLSGTLQHLVSGFGTFSTTGTLDQIQIGITTITYTPFALIFPTKADPAKFMVYNLYKSRNDSGLANQVKRRGLGNNPVAFRGYGITSRAATDTVGNLWKQL